MMNVSRYKKFLTPLILVLLCGFLLFILWRQIYNINVVQTVSQNNVAPVFEIDQIQATDPVLQFPQSTSTVQLLPEQHFSENEIDPSTQTNQEPLVQQIFKESPLEKVRNEINTLALIIDPRSTNIGDTSAQLELFLQDPENNQRALEPLVRYSSLVIARLESEPIGSWYRDRYLESEKSLLNTLQAMIDDPSENNILRYTASIRNKISLMRETHLEIQKNGMKFSEHEPGYFFLFTI